MIVWGGRDGFVHYDTGGRYNPDSGSWTATSTNNAPSARIHHSAVWTGSEMIVWGGLNGLTVFDAGGKYDPLGDSWMPTSITGAPSARYYHTAVWTGSEMIVWGGSDVNNSFPTTGGRYCAQPSTPLVQSAVSRKTHGSAGSFGVNLPLTGTSGIECRNGGGTNDYTIVLTFLANVSVSGNPQATVTSGIATVGNTGVSNGGMILTAGNVVTIPLTNVANAQTINVTLNAVNGSTNVVIPMSRLVGDTNGDGVVNSGDALQTRNRSGRRGRLDEFPFRCECRWFRQQRGHDGPARTLRRLPALTRTGRERPDRYFQANTQGARPLRKVTAGLPFTSWHPDRRVDSVFIHENK